MSYSSDRSQHPGAFGGAGWGPPPGDRPYGSPPWAGFTAWDPGPALRDLLACRPLRIAAIVLAFIWWWPVGLATLFVLHWSKRMGYWSSMCRDRGETRGEGRAESGPGRWSRWGCGGRSQQQSSSGNRAFDEYRAETLRRLEDEQKDFVSFLERLRHARDKAEFEQFLADRRQRPENGTPPTVPEQPSAA